MSRLYPQWIDVAKLIEPLHSHLLQMQQQQLQQQQQQQQQSNDHSANQNRVDSGSSSEDNLYGNLSKSPNGRIPAATAKAPASLRSNVLAASPLTDNGQRQPSENLSPAGDDGRQQLSRALSCSIMTSDSGHSSTSSSPSSSSSSSFDSCGEVVDANSAEEQARRQHFQKAGSEIQSQQAQQPQPQPQSNQAASYLKRKCYQRRQQQHHHHHQHQHQHQQQQQQERQLIDCGSNARYINGLISGLPGDGTSTCHSRQQVSMPVEFTLRERRFECIRVVRQLLEALNETNLILLRAIICVIWHIADNSDYNKMTSSNLGVCIGQSLLNDELQQHHLQFRGKKLHSFSLSMSSSSQLAQTNVPEPEIQPSANFTKRHRRARSQCLLASTLSLTNLSHLSTTSTSPTSSSTISNGHLASSISSNYLDSNGAQETAKFVPILVAFMIDNAKELFGSDVMNLFGPRRPLSHNDNNPDESTDDNSRAICSSVEQHQQPPIDARSTQQHAASGPHHESVATPTSNGVATVVAADRDSHYDASNDPLESKSTIVTCEQAQPNGNCSNLFVKFSGDERADNHQHHRLACKPLSVSPCQSPMQRHNRIKPVLVHVGSQLTPKTGDHMTRNEGRVLPTMKDKPTPRTSELASDSAATTTSILIVNAPKRQAANQMLGGCVGTLEFDAHRQGSLSFSNQADDDNSDDLSAKTSRHQQKPDSGTGENGETQATAMMSAATTQEPHKQQRPLSATESTTSSSRASSSTSGVHSESPAFSCEQDSASTSSASSTPPNNTSARPTSTCSSSVSSRCVSISSPTSSAPSSCTSPIDMDSSVDVVNGGHHHHHHDRRGYLRIEEDTAKTISHNEAMRHNLIDRICQSTDPIVSKAAETTATATTTTGGSSVPKCESRVSLSDRARNRTSFERPKSIASLSRSEIARNDSLGHLNVVAMRYQNDGRTIPHNHSQQYSSMGLVDTTDKESGGKFVLTSNRYKTHTLNRYTSASSQLVNMNRMPKIPFQYTTSCYGGEAVLFYPSETHLSQQQQQNGRQTQLTLQQQAGRFDTPPVQPRGCNRIQSLDRLPQLHHPSSSASYQQQQQQQPQRSHVLMLRDYYLSLQEQSHEKQQFRELLKRQQHQCTQQMFGANQRPTVTNTATINNHIQLIQQQQQHKLQNQQQQQQQYRQPQVMMMPPPVDPRQAQQRRTIDLNAMQAADDPTTETSGNHELMREQPASAAVAHQRVQPRMARIRSNQFNGLYVRHATSPMSNLDGANLITLDHRHQHHIHQQAAARVAIRKPLAANGTSSSLMAVSQSSLSQQSSKMSSSSSAEHSSDEEVCSSDECSTGGWLESTLV